MESFNFAVSNYVHLAVLDPAAEIADASYSSERKRYGYWTLGGEAAANRYRVIVVADLSMKKHRFLRCFIFDIRGGDGLIVSLESRNSTRHRYSF